MTVAQAPLRKRIDERFTGVALHDAPRDVRRR